jgi:cation diffusion facilitator family transporter
MNHSSQLATQAQSTIRYSIVVNLILSVVKFAAGILGNSFALIADAAESWVDFASSFLVWLGLKTAALPPDKNHPYGHGKAEPLSAMFVAVFMFSVACFIVYEAIQHIITPHESPRAWTIIVIVGVLITKEVLYRFMKKNAKKFKSNALSAEAVHQRTDSITSLAALLGIVISLVAGEGYAAADDWASLLAAYFILQQAFKVGKTSISELMDEAQPEEIVNDIRKTAIEVEGVIRINACFVRKMGFEWFVDIHIGLDGNQSVYDGHGVAHSVVDRIKEKFPQVYDVLTHIEPHEDNDPIS